MCTRYTCSVKLQHTLMASIYIKWTSVKIPCAVIKTVLGELVSVEIPGIGQAHVLSYVHNVYRFAI